MMKATHSGPRDRRAQKFTTTVIAGLALFGSTLSAAADTPQREADPRWQTSHAQSRHTHEPPDRQPARFDLVPLGGLGHGHTVAMGMNEIGQVVGWSQTSGPVQAVHAFVWDRGAIVDLGTLGGRWSEARDINDAGQIVGVSETADGALHAFMFANGVMFDLNQIPIFWPYQLTRSFDEMGIPILLPVPEIVDASAVSDTGWIAVTARLVGGSERAFVLLPFDDHDPLTPSYIIADMGVLPNADSSHAYGLNDQGQAVGASDRSAVIMNVQKDQEMQPLRPHQIERESEALAVNDLGIAVGWSAPRRSFTQTAALWHNNYRVDLPTWKGWSTQALAISNRTQIVGSGVFGVSDTTPDEFPDADAMLWDGYDLPVRLSRVTDFSASGELEWEFLLAATAIDETGRIAGYGRLTDGRAASFLLVPRDGN